MAEFAKIPYYDLKLESRNKRLPVVLGRADEISRLSRVLSRNINHNAMVVGPSGSGKTSLFFGWARAAKNLPAFSKFNIVLLDNGILQKISLLPAQTLGFYLEALGRIENSVVLI